MLGEQHQEGGSAHLKMRALVLIREGQLRAFLILSQASCSFDLKDEKIVSAILPVIELSMRAGMSAMSGCFYTSDYPCRLASVHSGQALVIGLGVENVIIRQQYFAASFCLYSARLRPRPMW